MSYTIDNFINDTFKNEVTINKNDDNVIRFIENNVIKHINDDMFSNEIIKIMGLDIRNNDEFREYSCVLGLETNDSNNSLKTVPWPTINEVYDKCNDVIGIDDIATNTKDCVNLIVSTIQNVLEKYPNSINSINHSNMFVNRVNTSMYSVIMNMDTNKYYFQLVLEPKVTL